MVTVFNIVLFTMKCIILVAVASIYISQSVGQNYEDYDASAIFQFSGKKSVFDSDAPSRLHLPKLNHNFRLHHPQNDEKQLRNEPRPFYNLADAPTLFENYKRNFNKQYKNSQDEREHYEYFVQNLKIINDLNAEGGTAIFDINVTTDRKS